MSAPQTRAEMVARLADENERERLGPAPAKTWDSGVTCPHCGTMRQASGGEEMEKWGIGTISLLPCVNGCGASAPASAEERLTDDELERLLTECRLRSDWRSHECVRALAELRALRAAPREEPGDGVRLLRGEAAVVRVALETLKDLVQGVGHSAACERQLHVSGQCECDYRSDMATALAASALLAPGRDGEVRE